MWRSGLVCMIFPPGDGIPAFFAANSETEGIRVNRFAPTLYTRAPPDDCQSGRIKSGHKWAVSSRLRRGNPSRYVMGKCQIAADDAR